jgi:hypothetical protein
MSKLVPGKEDKCIAVRGIVDKLVIDLIAGGGELNQPSPNRRAVAYDPLDDLLARLRSILVKLKGDSDNGVAFHSGFHRNFRDMLESERLEVLGRPSARNIRLVIAAACKIMEFPPMRANKQTSPSRSETKIVGHPFRPLQHGFNGHEGLSLALAGAHKLNQVAEDLRMSQLISESEKASHALRVRHLSLDMSKIENSTQTARHIKHFIEHATDITELTLIYDPSLATRQPNAHDGMIISEILNQTYGHPAIDTVHLTVTNCSPDLIQTLVSEVNHADSRLCSLTLDKGKMRVYDAVADNRRLMKIDAVACREGDWASCSESENNDSVGIHSINSIWRLEIALRTNRTLVHFEGSETLEQSIKISANDISVQKLIEDDAPPGESVEEGQARIRRRVATRIRSALLRNQTCLGMWQMYAMLIAAARVCGTRGNAIVALIPSILGFASMTDDGSNPCLKALISLPDQVSPTMLKDILEGSWSCPMTKRKETKAAARSSNTKREGPPALEEKTSTSIIAPSIASEPRLQRLAGHLYALRSFRNSVEWFPPHLSRPVSPPFLRLPRAGPLIDPIEIGTLGQEDHIQIDHNTGPKNVTKKRKRESGASNKVDDEA